MKQGSNTIMSTWFALKFWSNEIIDVDIIQPFTLIQLKVAHFLFMSKFCDEIEAFLKWAPAEHSIISAFRRSCSMIEAYLNHLYCAQLITLPVDTAFI